MPVELVLPVAGFAVCAESGDSDSDDAARGQARREPAPALDDLDTTKEAPDDEVERVLGHRWGLPVVLLGGRQSTQAVWCTQALQWHHGM